MMKGIASERVRAMILAALILIVFFGAWHIATAPAGGSVKVDEEYAKLVGSAAEIGRAHV